MKEKHSGKSFYGVTDLTCFDNALCNWAINRASYGTTKYCTYYLRHMACPNPNCMYLHEPGDDVDSYNKDTTTVPVG